MDSLRREADKLPVLLVVARHSIKLLEAARTLTNTNLP